MRALSERLRFDVSLEDLQTFLAVADLGSFSRAAERMSLSQPSISNRVKRLEAKLMVPLLHRTSRSVTLTEEGRMLQAEASETLQGLDALLREFGRQASRRAQQVDVAATLTVAVVALPPIVRAFQDRNREITVRLHDLDWRDVLASVADGRCEIAVMNNRDGRTDLEFECLVTEPSVIVAPRGHPLLDMDAVPFEEAMKYPILNPARQSLPMSAVISEAGRRGLAVPFSPAAPDVANVLTLISMAAAGLGVFVFAASLIPAELRNVVGVVPFADFDLPREFGLVTAKHRPLSASARRFRDFIRSSVKVGPQGWVVDRERALI